MTSATTELAQQPARGELKEIDTSHMPMLQTEASLMMDPRVFEHMQRVCKVYAASDVVPQQFRGNIANCMIAFELAHRMKANVFMLMQSMYVVQGKPGLEAKLVIGLVNMRGPFKGTIQYDMKRDDKGKPIACTAWAILKSTGERCESTITWDIVEKEGWSKKNGSKWLTMPEQMFRYRAAAWLARAYCPEVIMGMHTTDELDDTYGSTRYVVNESSDQSRTHRLAATLGVQPTDTIPHVTGSSPDGQPQPTDQATETAPSAGQHDDDSAPGDDPAGAAPRSTGQAEDAGAETETAMSLITRFAEMHGIEAIDAADRLDRFTKKLHGGKTLAQCSPETLANIRQMIERGDIKPGK